MSVSVKESSRFERRLPARTSVVEGLYRALAFLAVAAVGLGVVRALVLAARRRPVGRTAQAVQAAVASALIVAAASGLIQVATGIGPDAPPHVVYAAIAIAAIPAARSFAGRGGPRAQQPVIGAAFVVLGFVVHRLFVSASCDRGGPLVLDRR